MQAFLYAFNAILPILLLCAVGYLLKRIKIIDQNFVSVCNKIIFKVFLPCTLFVNIYTIEDFAGIDWTLVIFCVIGVLVQFGIGILASVLLIKDKSQKGVVALTSFRSNSVIIGLSLILLLFGVDGGAKMSVTLAFVIPLYTLLAVVVLSIFPQEGEKTNFGKVLLKIVTNPITIGVAVGLITLGIRSLIKACGGAFSIEGNLPWLYSAVKGLGGVTTTLALIALGGEFEFSASRHLAKPITISVILRLVVAPLLAFLVAYFFLDFSQLEYAVILCLFASPTAVTCVALSAEMGHDEELAGQIVVWSTLLCFVTLFIYIFVLSEIGLFPQ